MLSLRDHSHLFLLYEWTKDGHILTDSQIAPHKALNDKRIRCEQEMDVLLKSCDNRGAVCSELYVWDEEW
jgi:hypothetical protein